MTKIAIIIGSTRQGRHTDKLAKWIEKDLQHKKVSVKILDLAEYPLPFFNEEIPPRYNPERKPDSQTKKWLDSVGGFDGYVITTPEYNRAMPAVLKNAIDVLGYEMEDKPVAIVAHGSSGGAQAVASLRLVLPGVGAISIPQALFFSDRLADAVSVNGDLIKTLQDNPHGPQAQLDAQMKKLLWYAKSLSSEGN